MISGKITRLLIYAVILVFTISRMWVVFREYQDIDYNPISTLATIVLILISIVYFFFNLSTVLSSGLCRLILAFLIIGYLSTYLYGNPDLLVAKQLVFITFWEAVFFLFYLLTCRDIDTVDSSRRFFFLLAIPVTVLILYSNILRGSMGYDVERMGNNMFFYLLTLLPWLMTSGNRKLRLVIILFVLGMSVITLKRSAMVVSVICTLIFMYMEFFNGNNSVFRAILLCIIVGVTALLLMFYTNSASEGVAMERIENVEEDEGSGRLERYKDVLRLLRDEENRGKIVFGHGYRTVECSLGESWSAHNDFLEVVYDYGVLGLIIYSLFHLSLIRRVVYLKRKGSSYAEGYLMSYVIFFVMSMVSHLVIYPTYFIFLTSYWGAIEGDLIAVEKENSINW